MTVAAIGSAALGLGLVLAGGRGAVDPARCTVAPLPLVEEIARGLKYELAGAVRLGSAAAVRSADGADLYFVSAEIDGIEFEGEGDVATWAALGLDPATTEILSVDPLARSTTDWTPARDDPTKDELTMRSDGARESRACVGGGLSAS